MYKLLMMPWNSTIVCDLYFHSFLSNLGPNKAHMFSWDTSMFVMFLRSLLIPRNPWTSMKQCRSSFSSKPLDCPCSLRKTRIIKCQNKRNIGRKKNVKTKKLYFFDIYFFHIIEKYIKMIELQVCGQASSAWVYTM